MQTSGILMLIELLLFSALRCKSINTKGLLTLIPKLVYNLHFVMVLIKVFGVCLLRNPSQIEHLHFSKRLLSVLTLDPLSSVM